MKNPLNSSNLVPELSINDFHTISRWDIWTSSLRAYNQEECEDFDPKQDLKVEVGDIVIATLDDAMV